MGIFMEKVLGILGGMGPMATADLFTKITALTKASCDNDHLRVLIDSNAKIPDRTNAILYGGESPLPYMLDSALRLESMGAQCLIMPCNTAHYYINELQKAVAVPFINMIEETAKAVPEGCRPALLATSGTIKTGLYSNALKKRGFDLIVPEESHHMLYMAAIHDIKGGRVPDRGSFLMLLKWLKQKGADTFILGCTEIPLAFQWLEIDEPYVDATMVLARSAITFCGKEIRE